MSVTAIAPGEVMGAWTLDPGVILAVSATVVLYVGAIRRSGGVGVLVSGRQVIAFGGAVAALLLALVSPLAALSASLFGAHMVQHLLLTLVAAPLLLLGRLHVVATNLLPVGLRRRWGRRLARGGRQVGPGLLAVAAAVHVLTVLAWHVPVLYDAAFASPALHGLEHVTLLASALGFWAVMGAARPRPVAAAGLAAFLASVVFVLLAALLTSANAPWYDAHLTSTTPFGVTPMEDQQLAAAIMWVPGGMIYFGAAAAAIVRWIRADERAVRVVSSVPPRS